MNTVVLTCRLIVPPNGFPNPDVNGIIPQIGYQPAVWHFAKVPKWRRSHSKRLPYGLFGALLIGNYRRMLH
jgi:hypothetical protein